MVWTVVWVEKNRIVVSNNRYNICRRMPFMETFYRMWQKEARFLIYLSMHTIQKTQYKRVSPKLTGQVLVMCLMYHVNSKVSAIFLCINHRKIL